MTMLLVVDSWPMPDRNSADFRLTRLLQMLRQLGDIWICVPGENRQADRIGVGAVLGYRQALQAAGVRVAEGGVLAALRERRYAAVIFEWHFPALAWLETVRLEQPQARVVIDSVDVVFHRLEAKARVSGLDADRERASSTRRAELEIYGKSDLVITVTDADAAILREELPATPTFTLPNIHPMHAPVAIDGDSVGRLLFIGSYARPGGETNIDAMRWFCGEILPLVLAEAPGVSLRIVGGPRIDEVSSLESPNVQVLGFVPETQPYLAGSGISIAPLRFGGGMKGKIGEAMSFGLPVVTTTTGVEGFGLTPGRHVLVGDSPRAFADHVLALIRDDALRDRIRLAGHAFIRDHYSDAAVARRVEDLVHRIEDLPSRRPSLLATTAHRARQTWRRHVGWRLGRR